MTFFYDNNYSGEKWLYWDLKLQYEQFSFSHGLRVLMQRLKVEYNVTVTIDATLPQFDDHNSDISDYQRLIDDRFEN